MTTSVIVWDLESDPSTDMKEILSWQSYVQGSNVSSIPLYLENHAERLKKKYLAFIHDLGESKIGGKRVIDHFGNKDDFSFWWMTLLAEKSPFKSPGIYDCLRIMALEEILLERKPSGVILKSFNRELGQVIRVLCKNLAINFTWQPGDRPRKEWSLSKLYRALPYPVQGLVWFVAHLVTRWPLRNLETPAWFSGEGDIFLCSYFIHLDPVSCAKGHFYSRQWEKLPKYIHDSGRRTNWIQHFMPNPVVPNVQTGLEWLRSFNLDSEKQGKHSFLDSYLTWKVVGRVLKNWFWLNTLSWRLRKIQSAFYPKGSAVWLWPILRGDWWASVNGATAINNCLWMELFDAALGDMPRQKMGLYLHEKQGWESALIRAWRKHGHGEIIGVLHFPEAFWLLSHFDDPRSIKSKQRCSMPLPDRLAVIGPVALKAFTDAGYRSEQLVEVEALRYLNLLKGNAEPALGSTNRQTLKHSVSASAKGSVLILGDISPKLTHNFLGLLENAMKFLTSNYKFTFKPHPGNAVSLAKYPGLQVDEIEDGLHRILADFEVVLTTCNTSSALDAYLGGLTVILYSDGRSFNLSPLRGHSDVHFISTPEELTEVLQKGDQNTAVDSEYNEFFFLDPELPRWKKLLQRNSN